MAYNQRMIAERGWPPSVSVRIVVVTSVHRHIDTTSLIEVKCNIVQLVKAVQMVQGN